MTARNTRFFLITCLALALAACGGTTNPDGTDNGTGNGTGSGGNQGGGGTANNATQIDLVSSSTSLLSAAQTQNGVLLTAIVRDNNNNAVQNPDVQFSADSGRIISGDNNGANGTATASLFNAPDRANRTIRVTATNGTISDQIDIDVTGTEISISGPSAIATGETATFTATLIDSEDNPIDNATIKVESAIGGPVGANTVDTNAKGEATFSVPEQTAGTDTITVSARGATAERNITVGGKRLTFTEPGTDASSPTVSDSNKQSFTVVYSGNDGAINGSNIAFSASRGTLSTATDTTDANGKATTTVTSTVAGQSTVTASVGGVQASKTITFLADAPTTLILNAASATITPASSTTLTATARDKFSNLVNDKRVEFSLGKNSPGSLSSTQAMTNNTGTASVTYTASPSPASQEAQITATIADAPSVKDNTTITTAGDALSIRLGTGTPIQLSADGTTYTAPYAVLISDAAGNPAANASLRVKVRSKFYSAADSASGEIKCPSEDTNNNGILDSGEDKNGNNTLDPGLIATVPLSPDVDDTGVARFSVTYLSRFAARVNVELTATAKSAGSEGTDSLTFDLKDPGGVNGVSPFVDNCEN